MTPEGERSWDLVDCLGRFPPVSLFSQEKSILPTNHHRQIHSSTLTCCQSHTCSHTFRLGNSLHMLGLEINRPRYVGQYLVGWGEGEHTTGKDGRIWKSEKVSEKKVSQKKWVKHVSFDGSLPETWIIVVTRVVIQGSKWESIFCKGEPYAVHEKSWNTWENLNLRFFLFCRHVVPISPTYFIIISIFKVAEAFLR